MKLILNFQGLKFTPTPQRNTADFIKDTEEFCQKL